MKRIDGPGAVNGLFDPGNPFADGGPVDGTIVTFDWLNSIQETVIYPIEGQGITLDGADTSQLDQAIRSLIDELIGFSWTFTASEDLLAGEGFLERDVFSVVQADVLNGNPATAFYRGQFTLPKVPAENHQPGDALFWNQTNRELSNVDANGVEVGFAVAVAGAATTTVLARITGPPNL